MTATLDERTMQLVKAVDLVGSVDPYGRYTLPLWKILFDSRRAFDAEIPETDWDAPLRPSLLDRLIWAFNPRYNLFRLRGL